jgi:hypothetical protein
MSRRSRRSRTCLRSMTRERWACSAALNWEKSMFGVSLSVEEGEPRWPESHTLVPREKSGQATVTCIEALCELHLGLPPATDFVFRFYPRDRAFLARSPAHRILGKLLVDPLQRGSLQLHQFVTGPVSSARIYSSWPLLLTDQCPQCPPPPPPHLPPHYPILTHPP